MLINKEDLIDLSSHFPDSISKQEQVVTCFAEKHL
jgi:hypothetical protein